MPSSSFTIHTAVAARRAGVALARFARENALRLAVGNESLFPDNAFDLVTAGGTSPRNHLVHPHNPC